MKKTDYKGKTEKDLTKALYEKREALRNWKFGVAGAKAKAGEGKELRKDIARIMTELNSPEVSSKK